MCWSFDATLGFCIFESSILLYIWWRNVLNDRINVIGHSPILLQGRRVHGVVHHQSAKQFRKAVRTRDLLFLPPLSFPPQRAFGVVGAS